LYNIAYFRANADSKPQNRAPCWCWEARFLGGIYGAAIKRK